jgi:uncharacterized protein
MAVRQKKRAAKKKPSSLKTNKRRSVAMKTAAPEQVQPVTHDLPPSRLAGSTWVRYLYIAAGWISLALGIIGVVTPILPTTPFILLSGYCFARGSERFHTWIMRHKYFGPMIRAFRDEKRIPLKAKIIATAMIVVTMTATALVVRKPVAIIGMASVGVAVVIYIWTFKH